MPKLQKCLIANRGEIAVRIIYACRELDIQTVAIYSEADATAKHTQLADEAYLLGPASPTQSYLNTARILAIAQQSGCDCVHPGYGFLSESAAFAQAVVEAGLVWVGPSPDAIQRMGVKTEARALMHAAGVPLVPGFQPHSETVSEAEFIAAAQTIGYPIMVKAAGGGGGKGIRIVQQESELADALSATRSEAGKSFGDSRIFLEKYIEAARHVEIQVLADTHGNTVHLYERECSVQRRHQKIIEESPAPTLTEAQRQAMGQAAIKAAQAVNYVNAGTVEFILTPDGEFYFLEMNTRLQVEHPVTECVTGQDLVHLQFMVASGDPLPITQADIRQQGHAIECRIYAEDPYNHFLPAIGPVLLFRPAEGPGLRVDSGIQTGDEVGIHYDPLLAKLIVHAPTREAAIQRMQKALCQMVILGLTSNIPFLQSLLANSRFHAGTVDTAFVDSHLETLLPTIAEPSPLALIAAALTGANVGGNRNTSAGEIPVDSDLHSPWTLGDSFRLGHTTKRKI